MTIAAVFGLLSSPIGRVVAAGLVLLSVYVLGNHRGAQRERLACETAKAASVEAARAVDAAAGAEARARAAVDKQESADRMAAMQRRIDTYEHVTKSCPIGEEGVRMLDDVGSPRPDPGRLRDDAVRGAAPVAPSGRGRGAVPPAPPPRPRD